MPSLNNFHSHLWRSPGKRVYQSCTSFGASIHKSSERTLHRRKGAIAPIKDIRRCQAKLLETSRLTKNKPPPPYAATICDYLRANVFCQTMDEAIASFDKLNESHYLEVVRVKARLRKNPQDIGNKCILVNVVVKDPTVRPVLYSWSDWWINGRVVSMIAEVL